MFSAVHTCVVVTPAVPSHRELQASPAWSRPLGTLAREEEGTAALRLAVPLRLPSRLPRLSASAECDTPYKTLSVT